MNAVIFDLDGTVWDSMPVWKDMGKVLLTQQGVTFPENIVEILTPLGLTKGAEYLISLGLNLTVEEVLRLEIDYAIHAYRNNIPLKPGVEAYMQKLKTGGIKMCAFTAGPRELFSPAYERFGLSRYLDFALTSDELGIAKSDPKAFLAVAEKLNTPPAHITVYDDSLHVLKAAKQAGLKTFGVYDESAEKNMDKIKELADGYIMSFEELL